MPRLVFTVKGLKRLGAAALILATAIGVSGLARMNFAHETPQEATTAGLKARPGWLMAEWPNACGSPQASLGELQKQVLFRGIDHWRTKQDFIDLPPPTVQTGLRIVCGATAAPQPIFRGRYLIVVLRTGPVAYAFGNPEPQTEIAQ